MTTIEEIDRELAGYLARLDELEATLPLAADRFAKAKEAAEAFEDTGKLSAEDFVRERSRLNEARDVAEIEHKRIPAKITAIQDAMYSALQAHARPLIAPLRAKAVARKEEIFVSLESLFSDPADREWKVRKNEGVKAMAERADDVRNAHGAAHFLERCIAETTSQSRSRLQVTYFAKGITDGIALL